MNRELHRLYQRLFDDVRRYFRYEAGTPEQCHHAEIMMRETMRRIIDLQEHPETNTGE